MPKSDDPSQDAIGRLDKRLDAFQAGRAPKASPIGGVGGIGGAGAAYRMLGELLGGVLGGVGLGWLADRFAHTSPLGVVAGLLIGAGFSVFAVVRTASKIGARAEAQNGAAGAVPQEDDDEA